jgi:V-type H+-transporting ATPase subunit C
MALPLPDTAPSSKMTDDDQCDIDSARWDLFNKVRARLFEAVGNNADYFPIDLPLFKVGTLDGLMSTSQELERIDPAIDAVLSRLIQAYKSVIPENDTFDVYGKRPESALSGFSFNQSKYRTDTKLSALVAEIHDEVGQIDALVKTRMSEYSQSKNALSSVDGTRKGVSLLTKDMGFILDEYLALLPVQRPVYSDYMTTVFIILPKHEASVLKKEHMDYAPLIVPNSLHLIDNDEDYELYALILFRKNVEELREQIRKRKWTFKEYEYKADQRESNADKRTKLTQTEQGLHANLIRLLKTNVAEVFLASAHIKFIRCFVEAALRYGLPPNYLFMVVNVKTLSAERRIIRQLVRLLEQLKLPGISAVDLLSFGQISGATGDNAADDVQGEEAEMWSALNAGGIMDDLPFVRMLFEW